MAWRVERNAGRGWSPNGIIETNFSWASTFWTNLGQRWNVRYRLRPI